jgi:hypothetical protein
MLRSTLFAEGGTFVGFFEPFEDLAADADGRLLGVDFLHSKEARGIEGLERVLELVAALRNRPHPSPLLVTDLEDAPHELLRGRVADVLSHTGERSVGYDIPSGRRKTITAPRWGCR